jgi:glycosyltransferase involved in cell wall biosynthesis
MNICQVGTGFTSIPPNLSAATEEVVYYLSKELVSLNCNVEIVDILDKKRRPSDLSISEVPYFSIIKSIKSNSPGLIAKRISFSFFSTMWLRQFKSAFDVIHFHNQFPASMFQLFSKLLSEKSPPTVFTVHNPVWGLSDSNMPKNVKLKYVLEIEAIKRASKVVVVSDTLKRCVTKRMGLDSSSVAVVPNGVNTDLFHPSMASSILRKNIATNGEKIVLCVGRICRYKGQKILIEAIPKIIQENIGVKFVFVGPVDDAKYFKEINDTLDSLSLRKHCVFTGTVPSDVVPMYFATADVCALPSITEAGPPLTLFQAMSSARPIVASAIPQNMEAAKQGDEIIFVDPSNVDELSCVITRLLTDDDLSKRMGEKARKTALGTYDWKVTARETLRLYENLIRN